MPQDAFTIANRRGHAPTVLRDRVSRNSDRKKPEALLVAGGSTCRRRQDWLSTGPGTAMWQQLSPGLRSPPDRLAASCPRFRPSTKLVHRQAPTIRAVPPNTRPGWSEQTRLRGPRTRRHWGRRLADAVDSRAITLSRDDDPSRSSGSDALQVRCKPTHQCGIGQNSDRIPVSEAVPDHLWHIERWGHIGRGGRVGRKVHLDPPIIGAPTCE